MNIGILEPKNFSEKALAQLKQLGTVNFYDGAGVSKFIEDKEILFVRLKHFIGKYSMESAKQLKIICSPTTGLYHIDLDEAKARGVVVLSLKSEEEFLDNVRATPEHAFGLILALLRNYKTAFLNKNNEEWDRDRNVGSEIYNNKFGIIGMGRVGRRLANYLMSFGANIYYYDKKDIDAPLGAFCIETLEELILETNVIILAASYEKENIHMIYQRCIDHMKDKFFINIARGELVDENYLIKKIEVNHFKGVALDVIKNETGENNLKRLIEMTENRNLIITPHIGGATVDSMKKTEEFIAEKLINELESVQ